MEALLLKFAALRLVTSGCMRLQDDIHASLGSRVIRRIDGQIYSDKTGCAVRCRCARRFLGGARHVGAAS